MSLSEQKQSQSLKPLDDVAVNHMTCLPSKSGKTASVGIDGIELSVNFTSSDIGMHIAQIFHIFKKGGCKIVSHFSMT